MPRDFLLRDRWDLQSVAAIITTSVPLIIFLIFQRQFAAGAETRSGAKD